MQTTFSNSEMFAARSFYSGKMLKFFEKDIKIWRGKQAVVTR